MQQSDFVQKNIKFTKNLVKGKIAETIFMQMIQQSEQFESVLPNGFEYSTPELINYKYKLNGKNQHVLHSIRHAPDFIVTDIDDRIYLVEVKYSKDINQSRFLKIAQELKVSWPEAWIFVVTPSQFLFDKVEQVVEKNGIISPLSTEVISQVIQEKYLGVLKEFNLGGDLE